MNETESGYIKETDNMGREKFWEDIGRPENSKKANNVVYNSFMTEETTKKDMCCEACTCTNSHKSEPSTEE